jgi:hypothetical protein
MSRIKLGVLTGVLFALVAMSAVAASSASAAFVLSTTACEGGVPALCWNSEGALLEFTGTEEATGKLEAGTENLLKGNLGENIRITCTAAAVTGTIKQAEPLVVAGVIEKSTIAFSGCTITETAGLAKKCKINLEKVTTKALGGTFLNADPVSTTTFKPEGSETFTGIVFENNGAEVCPATVKGEKLVKGKQVCNNVEPEVHATVHLIQCLTTGSELKLGENVAEFDATFELTLKNTTDAWDLALA